MKVGRPLLLANCWQTPKGMDENEGSKRVIDAINDQPTTF
jgi:hypothetical protein